MIGLSVELCGSGAAEIRLSGDHCETTVPVSNETDVLGDLARTLVHMLHYAETAEVVTLDPPAEYLWQFDRRGHDGLSLTVVRREAMADLDPGGPERVVFDGSGGLVEVVRQLVGALTDISRTHGISGYESLWENHEFPRKLFRELKRRLAKADRRIAEQTT